MKMKRTTNQLRLTPMRMPKIRASWIVPVPGTRPAQAACGVWRSTIASKSVPAGSVP